MTHEYNIGIGGRIEAVPGGQGAVASAIAWAADRVLAVGQDDVVRAISRGDSVFLDLAGAVVTPLPTDLERAAAVLSSADRDETSAGLAGLLADAGLLARDVTIEPGSPADLAFWRVRPAAGSGDVPAATALLGVVRAGAFTQGHPRRGPFQALLTG